MSTHTEYPIPLNAEFAWFREINAQNMKDMFDPTRLLPGSMFYPASADDGNDIEHGSFITQSFVHVDYSMSKRSIERAMRSDFYDVGYDLVNVVEIPKSSLTPGGWQPSLTSLSSFERSRLQRDNIPPTHKPSFALWAVYRLQEKLAKVNDKAEMFSLLHIGGEACATLDALYVSQAFTPKAVCILYPGHGYGDNWTNFFKPDDCLYRLM